MADPIIKNLANKYNVPKSSINDTNVIGAKRIIQGSGIAQASGLDPTKLDEKTLKTIGETSVGDEPSDDSDKDLSNQRLLASALMGIGSTIIGSLFGGKAGGAAGAQAGVTGLEATQKFGEAEDEAKSKKEDKAEKRKQREEDLAWKEKDYKQKQELAQQENANRVQIEQLKQSGDLAKEQTKANAEMGSMGPVFDYIPTKAVTKAAEKDFQETATGVRNVQSLADELDGLVEKYGTEQMPGPVKTKMQRLVTEMQLNLKDVNKLGVLTGPDMGLLEKLVPDPTELSSWSADNIRAGLTDLKSNAQIKLDNAAKARGYVRPSQETPGVTPVPEGDRQILDAASGKTFSQSAINQEFMRRFGTGQKQQGM